MKLKSLFSLGIVTMLFASVVHAEDKYPLDPAYAANKKAMAEATAYEVQKMPSSNPSSVGDKWKLIYSGAGKSSVTIPSGIKFVAVTSGNSLATKSYPIPTNNNNKILLDDMAFTEKTCSGVPGNNHGTSCSTKDIAIRIYKENNRIFMYNYNISNNIITSVYVL
ncbi:hypothetical protein HC725_15895 [Vibrio sp. S17_S38]|uniref:hypothetical protein n=1 Tax=Vibrio sp. S17_S38 TaxID=2720229 RepID=UPI0016813AAB|nr:hypothetical protein [Vibrio sp. S17_S38]MBD1574736.1 hypothetical protein [Vibrio sp. S17_S38]